MLEAVTLYRIESGRWCCLASSICALFSLALLTLLQGSDGTWLLSQALDTLLGPSDGDCSQVPLPRSAPVEYSSDLHRNLRNASLVYHFHMPKAGGTTLSKDLARDYCRCAPGLVERSTFSESSAACECPFIDVHEATTRCTMRLEHCR